MQREGAGITMRTQYLSARQAAWMLGVSKAYACRLFSRGVIPAEKVDTEWIVQRKDVQSYLDEKDGIPVYYRSTDGWTQNDCYFLFRCLDKMVNDRRRRYDEELSSIDYAKLSPEARAILRAERAYERFPNLAATQTAEPLCPPVVLSRYPALGAHPAFEEAGLIL